ncbi:nitrate transporter [Cristinia sonorae]|uniref:Nitrate/nitrite transporter n=1 Tax=Cristinia sonorae TaxID=1940300 RepID=A0A8K0UH71_9AGAR|nr:nitrate transporter [Cristinia sonorae]
MSTLYETSAWQYLTVAKVNAINRKCMTLPILNLRSQYARNFHLSWLGFWTAFLSWFAFSPLIPEAVKNDLKLTPQKIGNSNIVSLCATLIVRLIVGPLVDRYGPRRVMAALLVIGAIPSGLAGTVHTAGELYTIRFFIGILGGTFVPCQAWTTVFFDKSIVGRANALVGGWGNAGGGFTFLIMVALYDRLVRDGLSPHSAWRAAFAVVPVPACLCVAAAIMIFGTDHPNGAWENRHDVPPAHMQLSKPQPSADIENLSTQSSVVVISTEKTAIPTEKKQNGEGRGSINHAVEQKDHVRDVMIETSDATSELDVAINEGLTWSSGKSIIFNPLTWLPALAYLTTFGFELAVDANLANVLFNLFHTRNASFGQTKAGYVASIYGLLNVFTRPLGGYSGDIIYRRFGISGKKYLMLVCGVMQGLLSIGLGIYADSAESSLAVVIVLFVLVAVVNEVANGINFSLVPHCNPSSNGFMSGIVGAMGNVGGIIFALIFRFGPAPLGKAFWISGTICAVVNVAIAGIRIPSKY